MNIYFIKIIQSLALDAIKKSSKNQNKKGGGRGRSNHQEYGICRTSVLPEMIRWKEFKVQEGNLR